ncbi:hypothetical protein NUSPORA_02190 [Nucleospora cyclopteri]
MSLEKRKIEIKRYKNVVFEKLIQFYSIKEENIECFCLELLDLLENSKLTNFQHKTVIEVIKCMLSSNNIKQKECGNVLMAVIYGKNKQNIVESPIYKKYFEIKNNKTGYLINQNNSNPSEIEIHPNKSINNHISVPNQPNIFYIQQAFNKFSDLDTKKGEIDLIYKNFEEILNNSHSRAINLYGVKIYNYILSTDNGNYFIKYKALSLLIIKQIHNDDLSLITIAIKEIFKEDTTGVKQEEKFYLLQVINNVIKNICNLPVKYKIYNCFINNFNTLENDNCVTEEILNLYKSIQNNN